MRQYTTLYDRLVANTKVVGECWIWQGRHTRPNGYPVINLRRNGKHYTIRAHRLMLEIVHEWHFPHDEAGHYVCFTPSCINPAHLCIQTFAENQSTRRGYKPCEGSWIPTLYPTPERLLQEAADDAWDGIGAVIGGDCPF